MDEEDAGTAVKMDEAGSADVSTTPVLLPDERIELKRSAFAGEVTSRALVP